MTKVIGMDWDVMTKDDRRQGMNGSLYVEPYDRVLDGYRKGAFGEWFAKGPERPAPGSPCTFAEAAEVMRAASKWTPAIFSISEDTEGRLVMKADLTGRNGITNSAGYTMWGPVAVLGLREGPGGEAVLEVEHEGRTSVHSVAAAGLEDWLLRMKTAPVEIEKEVLGAHFAECLPASLRSRFRSVTLTEDMGCSGFAGGDFTYGHDVELSMDGAHSLVFSYIIGLLWMKGSAGNMFSNVRKAREVLGRMAPLLDGLDVVSDHANDCGTHIARTVPSGADGFMDEITRFEGNDYSFSEADLEHVKTILRYHRYPVEGVSAEEILEEFRRGYRWRQIKAVEVRSNLRAKRRKWPVEIHWDGIRVYTSGPHRWSREVYVKIPYDCPADRYMGILAAADDLKELQILLEHDDSLSVGMFACADSASVQK